MYKVSSSAVPRTTLPSIHRSVFYRTDQVEKKKHFMSKPVKSLDISAVSLIDLRLNTVGRRRTVLTPPSTPTTPATPSSAELEEQMSLHDKTWRQFTMTETGEPDTSIVRYDSKKSAPSDFHPIDVDAFLAERLLKEVDIDPKLIFS